jgi:hypothetical protein
MIPIAKLVGPLIPDRLRVTTQIKKGYLALKVGGWA